MEEPADAGSLCFGGGWWTLLESLSMRVAAFFLALLVSLGACAQVFSPGHNGFFLSSDGKQNWIIYHANSEPHMGCGNQRSPRMQPSSFIMPR